MSAMPPVFDTEVISRLEDVCRNRVDADPCDMEARVSLAWCLYLQAIHSAGQESVLHAGEAAPRDGAPNGHGATLARRDARDLLKESLKHACTVIHLSRRAPERRDAERLRFLVESAGGAAALAEAETESKRILSQMTLELLQGAGTASEL